MSVPTAPTPGLTVRRLDPRAIDQVRIRLATLLLDAVADGHALGFLAGLDDLQLDAYWRGVEQDVARGRRVLLAAERNGLLMGCVQLDLCQEPNGANRAEVQKMLVHVTLRRRGIGRALLEAAEIEALAQRRGLLLFVTDEGSGAARLAAGAGYLQAGVLPDYCCTPNGHWRPGVVYYKTLFARARR